MNTYRHLTLALRELELTGRPAIVHTSLSALWHMRGGAETVVAALLDTLASLVVPTFTYKTMLIPETGPPNNGLVYGSQSDENSVAEFFHPDMPADKVMGVVPQTVLQHPQAERSMHPLLSFAGVNASPALRAQSYDEPLAPIRLLAEQNGWVVLIGVGHTVNTAIQLGERLAGRKTFVRWALTAEGVRQCPGFLTCCDGFDAIEPHLAASVRTAQLDKALVQAMPLRQLIQRTRQLVEADPLALLCKQAGCPRCNAIRTDVARRMRASS